MPLTTTTDDKRSREEVAAEAPAAKRVRTLVTTGGAATGAEEDDIICVESSEEEESEASDDDDSEDSDDKSPVRRVAAAPVDGAVVLTAQKTLTGKDVMRILKAAMKTPKTGTTPKVAKAAKASKLLDTPITITVLNGQGKKVSSGKVTSTLKITLIPSKSSLKFIKAECRRYFGLSPSQRQSTFTFETSSPNAALAVTLPRLVDGMSIVAQYSFAPGNLSGLLRGGSRFGRAFGRGYF